MALLNPAGFVHGNTQSSHSAKRSSIIVLCWSRVSFGLLSLRIDIGNVVERCRIGPNTSICVERCRTPPNTSICSHLSISVRKRGDGSPVQSSTKTNWCSGMGAEEDNESMTSTKTEGVCFVHSFSRRGLGWTTDLISSFGFVDEDAICREERRRC